MAHLGCIYESENGQTQYCEYCDHDDVPYCKLIDDDDASIGIEGIDKIPAYCPLQHAKSETN